MVRTPAHDCLTARLAYFATQKLHNLKILVVASYDQPAYLFVLFVVNLPGRMKLNDVSIFAPTEARYKIMEVQEPVFYFVCLFILLV